MVVAETPAAVSGTPVIGKDGVLLGGGYAGPGQDPRVVVQEKVVVQAAPAPVYEAYRVRVTGRGAAPVAKSLSEAQRRLLAMRASQLDAYRNIAEEVQGFRLTGSSAVANLVAVNDIFRTYVDAYLRGVRVLSTSVKHDGSAETVAELVLDENFYKTYLAALSNQAQQVQRAAEAMPVAARPDRLAPSADKVSQSCSGKSCTWGADFYLSK